MSGISTIHWVSQRRSWRAPGPSGSRSSRRVVWTARVRSAEVEGPRSAAAWAGTASATREAKASRWGRATASPGMSPKSNRRSGSQHLDTGDLPALAVDGVDGAGEARVEGVDGAERLEGQLGVGDRVAHEGRLVRTHLLVLIARTGVPGGWHHRLVVRELAVLDDAPVGEGSAGRLMEADALVLALGELRHRVVEDGGVALPDVLHEQLPVLLDELAHDGGADGAGGDAA